MAVDIRTYRIRIGCFMRRWTRASALCNWTKGPGSKKCNMAFCVVMCMLLLCAGDAERCPGPTQTRLTSFEAKSMQDASGGSDPPQRRRPSIISTFAGLHAWGSLMEKWTTIILLL